jgi:phosphoglycolate phosphatase
MDKWIIFDFDGTLADTLQAWIRVWDFLARKHGYKIIGPEDYPRLKGMPSLAIKADLGVPWWRVWTLERAGRKKFAEQMLEQKLFPNMAGTLKELKRRGFHLAILTSNSSQSVESCLQNNGCEGIFDFIYAGNALFKKGRKLKKLLKSHNINPSQAVYVGDETRDIDAARFAGVKSAAVTWGVNSKEILQEHRPDFLADSPQKLLEILN